ncbi:MAG: hypothetical protein HY936_09820 [Nitrosomonadales bacterium]|nr:hypothetical protein [Nitrosomonadales bacterium]
MKMRPLSFKHKLILVLMFIALMFLPGYSNVPQAGIWRDFIASDIVKSAEAADAPLCKVNLASLSITSGAPGDVFEMYGEWEDTQGAKTAAINMGSGNKLEILSWTSKALSVRIPKGLRFGEYKVGVYCNNPPHWQGSGFKNFIVTAPAFEDVRKNGVSLPATETNSPLIAAPDGAALQPDKDSTIPADANASAPQQKAVHKEPVASPQPKDQATNSAGDIVDAVIKTLSGILAELESRTGMLYFAGAVALLLFLNYLFKPKVEVDAQINKKSYVSEPHANFDMFATDAKIFKPITGVCNGVEYAAENLGDIDLGSGYEPLVTVHIGAKTQPIKWPLEINAREQRPVMAQDNRAEDINSLLDCGATYIDIGYNTDWVAVELPSNRVTIDISLIENVVGCLIRIRDLS